MDRFEPFGTHNTDCQLVYIAGLLLLLFCLIKKSALLTLSCLLSFLACFQRCDAALLQDKLLSFDSTELRGVFGWTCVHIVRKDALFRHSIGERHRSVAVLYPIHPLALVAAAISPVHFTIAVPLVILVAALVTVARLPSEDT